MIILMADGSSKGNPGPIQIGYVIWDRTKNARSMRPVHRHSEFKGAGTNNEAEYMAIIEGLKHLTRTIIQNEEIYVYSDSQLAIKQITGEYKVKHENMLPLKAELDQTLINLRGRHQCKVYFYWVPRQLTDLADKEATRERMSSCFAPSAIQKTGQT